jgi:hypothetical protein
LFQIAHEPVNAFCQDRNLRIVLGFDRFLRDEYNRDGFQVFWPSGRKPNGSGGLCFPAFQGNIKHAYIGESGLVQVGKVLFFQFPFRFPEVVAPRSVRAGAQREQ